MKLHPNKLVTHRVLQRLPALGFKVAVLPIICFSSIYFSSQARAEDRPKPLHIQIPSIPENVPKAQVVDNNLPVYLLDAQIPTDQELKHSAEGAAPTSSGQLVIGATPESQPTAKTLKISPKNNAKDETQLKPQLLVGEKKSTRKPISGNLALQKHGLQPTQEGKIPALSMPASPVLTASVDTVSNQTSSSLAVPQTLAQSAPLVTSTETKSFLNLFPMNQPNIVGMSETSLYQQKPLATYTQPVAKTLQITSPEPDAPEKKVASTVEIKKPVKTISNPDHVLKLPEENKQVAKAEPTNNITDQTQFLDAGKPFVPPANDSNTTQSSVRSQTQEAPVAAIDSNTPEARKLNEATASLSESMQKFNPFEADMPSLVSWAEQKKSQAIIQTSNASASTTQNLSPALPSSNTLPSVAKFDNSTAEQMATIAPAAGTTPAATTSPDQKSPPVRSGILIEEADSDDSAVADSTKKLASIDPETKPIAEVSNPSAPNLPAPTPSSVPSSVAPILANNQGSTKELSSSSERILKKIPSKLAAPKKMSKQRIDIEHEKSNPSVFSELDKADTVAAHEAMGLKIEVKRQAFNANSELERAYDALAAGNTEIAMESYKRILSNDPNNIQALFGAGAILHRSGDLDGAKSYYSRVLARDPDNRDTLNNFLSLVADESPDEALTKLKDLEKRNPDFSPIPAQISYIYQKLGDISQAGQYMIKALSLAPNNLTYKYNLAILLDKQGAKQDAASFYQQLIEAHQKGASIPGNIDSIQERLTFIRSNSK